MRTRITLVCAVQRYDACCLGGSGSSGSVQRLVSEYRRQNAWEKEQEEQDQEQQHKEIVRFFRHLNPSLHGGSLARRLHKHGMLQGPEAFSYFSNGTSASKATKSSWIRPLLATTVLPCRSKAPPARLVTFPPASSTSNQPAARSQGKR